MVPVWILVTLLFLQALSFVLIAWVQSYFSHKGKSASDQYTIDILDRFLSRRIEDVQQTKMLSALGGAFEPDEVIEPEGDPAMHDMTPEEVRATLEATQQEIDQAEKAELR